MEQILNILIGFLSLVIDKTNINIESNRVKNIFTLPGTNQSKTISDYSLDEIDANFKNVKIDEINAYTMLYNNYREKSVFTGSTDFTTSKRLIKVTTKSIGIYKEVLDLKNQTNQ